MKKDDLVKVRSGTDYARMLPDPDAVGLVVDADGFRCWVEFKDPPVSAQGWPTSAFMVVGKKRGRELDPDLGR